MRQRLRWADGKVVKDVMDSQLAALLGPRGEATQHKNTEEVTRYIRGRGHEGVGGVHE